MFVRLITLLCLAAFSDLGQGRVENSSFVRRQVMIVVKPNAKLSDWLPSLPRGAQLIREQHPFYLVRLQEAVRQIFLTQLKKNPFIVRVIRDQMVEATGSCSPQSVLSDSKRLVELTDILSGNCALAPACECLDPILCGQKVKNPLLAQMAMGGDLMLEEIKRIGLKEDHTKIAVLDTGLRPELAGFMSRPIEIGRDYGGEVRSYKTVTDFDNDHGANVISLISGRGGVGLAPSAQVQSFRISVNDKSTSLNVAYMAILDSCRSGHKIINLAFARIDPDVAGETAMPELLGTLAKNGCIVVKSAGNHPSRGPAHPTPLDDSWLRVGGVHPENRQSGSYVRGELSAPGFNVGTLGTDPKFNCLDLPLRLENGSSLTAPLVSSVLYNVRGILAKDDRFQSLPGEQQVALLNRILKSSERSGLLNGLRAVLLAEQWTTRSEKPTAQADIDLLLVRHPPSLCRRPKKEADLTQLTCEQRRESYKEMRFRLAACDTPPLSEVRSMAIALAKLNEYELGFDLVNHIADPKEQDLLAVEAREAERRRAYTYIDRLEGLQTQLGHLSRELEQNNQLKVKSLSDDAIPTLQQGLRIMIPKVETEVNQLHEELKRLQEPSDYFNKIIIESTTIALNRQQSTVTCLKRWQTNLAQHPNEVSIERWHQIISDSQPMNYDCQSVIIRHLPREDLYFYQQATAGVPLQQIQTQVADHSLKLEKKIQAIKSEMERH